MELADYLRVLRKYWVSVVAIILVGVVSAAVVSLLTTPTYTANASVFVTVQSAGSAGELNQGSTYAENQVKSFAQVVTMPAVLDPVIARLGLDTDAAKLAEDVTVTVPTNTAIIQIAVVGTDPALTAKITNAVADELVVVIGKLSPADDKGKQPVIANVVAPAAVPTERTSPRVLLNLALGALAGLLIGVSQAVLRARFDTRIVTADDIAEVTDHAVIGGIAFDPDAGEHPLVIEADPHSPRSEAYRRLRTNLQFLNLEGQPRALVVTSSLAGEGKTTSAINIATTLAEAGERVLLIDADLRRPKVATYLNLENAAGLSTVIIGRAGLDDVVQPVGEGNLHVLTAGQTPPNPSELLGSSAMERLLQQATQAYSTVILDSPPLLPVTDATILAGKTAGALVVVGSGTTRKEHLLTALESVEQVGAQVLGVVLNKVRAKRSGYGSYDVYATAYYGHDDAQPRKKARREPTRVA